MILRSLLRDSAIYGGGDFTGKLVALATFPVIAAALSTAAFGMLDLALSVAALGGAVARCGLNSAVQRYYWDAQTPQGDQARIVSTGFGLTLILGLLLGLIAYLATPLILSTVLPPPANLGWMGLVGVALLLCATQWAQYLQDVMRLHFAPWRFLTFALLTRIASALLAVAAVTLWNGGVDGVLLGQSLPLLLLLPLGLLLIRRDLTAQIDLDWSRRLLAYGVPLMYTEFAYWLFSSTDRWMLASMIGVDSVGVYSVAFRFSTIAVFCATAFGMAWSPFAMKLRLDFPHEYRKMYAEMLLVLLLLMGTVAGGLALFSGEIIGLLMPVEFAAAAVPLSVLCLMVVLQATQQITAVGISLSQRTSIFAYLVWLAAVMNAAFNFVLIPRFGVAGAAWASLLAHSLLSAGFLLFTQHLHPLPIPWKRLCWILLLGAAVMLVSLEFQETEISAFSLLAKLGFAGVCLALALPAVKLGVFRTDRARLQGVGP